MNGELRQWIHAGAPQIMREAELKWLEAQPRR